MLTMLKTGFVILVAALGLCFGTVSGTFAGDSSDRFDKRDVGLLELLIFGDLVDDLFDDDFDRDRFDRFDRDRFDRFDRDRFDRFDRDRFDRFGRFDRFDRDRD